MVKSFGINNLGINRLGLPFGLAGDLLFTYWKTQDEVLFFGEISKITDGKLYNQKAGATDFLTVGGVAGSYTFQAPNTAPYIAADTDYIWFKSNAVQRTTTEAELVSYDFTRSIIKYQNASPYSIQVIMILSANLDTAKMRNDFSLSVWWSNVLSIYGYVKENRTTGKSVWTPEAIYPVCLDTNTAAWYDSSLLSTITKDVLDRVSLWKDRLLSGNDLEQATDAKKPIWSANGILFDGTQQSLRKAFALNSPETLYLVFKQITWTLSDRICDGVWTTGNENMCLLQNPNGYKIALYSTSVIGATVVSLDTFVLSRGLFNGASSELAINNGAAVTGSLTAKNGSGFTLGGNGNTAGASGCSNIQVKEAIIRRVADSAEDIASIKAYLNTKYSLW